MSIYELMHLGQLARTRQPCKFNFNSPRKNLAKYNQRVVPCYDLSQVRLAGMSTYVGNTDRLVSWADVNTTMAQLTGECAIGGRAVESIVIVVFLPPT